MRRPLHAIAATVVGVVAAGTLSAPADASTTPTSHTFSCTRQIAAGRPYTKQTVTGTVTGSTPTNVSVISYQNVVLVSNPKPKLDNAFWGGYYKTTYHDNQWKVGTDPVPNNVYYVMFPDTAPAASFTITLVSLFNGGAYGNWQNTMPCTLTS